MQKTVWQTKGGLNDAEIIANYLQSPIQTFMQHSPPLQMPGWPAGSYVTVTGFHRLPSMRWQLNIRYSVKVIERSKEGPGYSHALVAFGPGVVPTGL